MEDELSYLERMGTRPQCGHSEVMDSANRCPYCGKFVRFIWIAKDHYWSSWYQETGIVDGSWICEQCGKEM